MTLLPNKIHLGDCVEKLKEIGAESVDLVFADPPFNIGYQYDVYHDQRSGSVGLLLRAWPLPWQRQKPQRRC